MYKKDTLWLNSGAQATPNNHLFTSFHMYFQQCLKTIWLKSFFLFDLNTKEYDNYDI